MKYYINKISGLVVLGAVLALSAASLRADSVILYQDSMQGFGYNGSSLTGTALLRNRAVSGEWANGALMERSGTWIGPGWSGNENLHTSAYGNADFDYVITPYNDRIRAMWLLVQLDGFSTYTFSIDARTDQNSITEFTYTGFGFVSSSITSNTSDFSGGKTYDMRDGGSMEFAQIFFDPQNNYLIGSGTTTLANLTSSEWNNYKIVLNSATGDIAFWGNDTLLAQDTLDTNILKAINGIAIGNGAGVDNTFAMGNYRNLMFTVAIPEPPALALTVAGAVILGLAWWRKNKRSARR
ncbi:MAG: hypothetical protein LBK60_08285 [Verrucomicrobiales bacterium]|jgi:hypothetical protein|nr:hypothetical protein [Verrucomicrobiales bacterium]